MKDSLTKQGLVAHYTFDRPVAARPPKVLNTFTGIKYVFNDPTRFNSAYDLKGLGSGYGYFLAFDKIAQYVCHACLLGEGVIDCYVV